MGQLNVEAVGQRFHSILSSFVKHAEVKTVLELGVCTGKGSRVFLEAVGKSGRVWGIDPVRRAENTDLLKRDWPNWEFIVQDDLTVDWTQEVDLLFIDSLHDYAHCLAELWKFSPFVRRWIFLHDTVERIPVEPVVRALRDFLPTDSQDWAVCDWYHDKGLTLLMRL